MTSPARGGCAGADATATGCFGGSPMFTTEGRYAECCLKAGIPQVRAHDQWREESLRVGKMQRRHGASVAQALDGMYPVEKPPPEAFTN